MDFTNENILAGMCCPGCGSEGPFSIQVMTFVTVEDDGFYPDPDSIRALDFADSSVCCCPECEEWATVADFRAATALWAETVLCTCCENETPASTAHAQSGGYVGDQCCWPEHMRASA